MRRLVLINLVLLLLLCSCGMSIEEPEVTKVTTEVMTEPVLRATPEITDGAIDYCVNNLDLPTTTYYLMECSTSMGDGLIHWCVFGTRANEGITFCWLLTYNGTSYRATLIYTWR